MRKSIFVFVVVVMLGLSSLALAADQKIVGVVEKIQFSGNSATVMLKDNKTGTKVPITVTDSLTLDKLRDKRIGVGDEIRCKFYDTDGKNVSKLFRKTAGC